MAWRRDVGLGAVWVCRAERWLCEPVTCEGLLSVSADLSLPSATGSIVEVLMRSAPLDMPINVSKCRKQTVGAAGCLVDVPRGQ